MGNKKSFLMALVIVMFAFASCSKKENPSEKVSGEYKGYTLASSNYFSEMFTANENLTLTRTSDNTVNLAFTSGTWGEFVITGAVVEGATAPYAVKGAGTVKMAGMGGQVNEYGCSVEAVIGGSNNDVFTFDIPAVMGGTKVVLHIAEAPVAYYVAKKYNGNVSYSVASTTYDPFDASITIKKETDNTVSLVIPSTTAGSMTIPELTISGITVSTTNHTNFTIEEKEINETVDGMNVIGLLNGNVNNGTLTLNYSLKPGSMPMSIVFVFTGN